MAKKKIQPTAISKRKVQPRAEQSVDERNEIKAWIESEEQDFDAGYELFVRFSHNRALALMLARKRRLSKLIYELQKIAAREVIKESPVMPIGTIKRAGARNQEHSDAETQIEKTGKKLVVIDERINYDDLPEEMKALYDQNREAYKEMRSLHEKMKLAKKDVERAEYRKQLVAKDDLIAANWEKMDAWANGEEETTADTDENPDTPGTEIEGTEEQTSEVDATKEINAARSYISRSLPKLAELEGDEKDKLIGKIQTRVDTLLKFKADISPETKEELKKAGLLNEDNGNE